MFSKRDKIQIMEGLPDSRSSFNAYFHAALLLGMLFLTFSFLVEEAWDSGRLYLDGRVHKVVNVSFITTDNSDGYKDRRQLYRVTLENGKVASIALSEKIDNEEAIKYLVWLEGTEVGTLSESAPTSIHYVGGEGTVRSIIFLLTLMAFWCGAILYVLTNKKKDKK